MSSEGSTPISTSIEEPSPARAFKIVNEILGWGDPVEDGINPGIWFIGIEERYPYGGEEGSGEDQIKEARREVNDLYERTHGKWYDGTETTLPTISKRTPVFQYIAKIACKHSKSFPEWRSYRKDKLFRKDSRIFQANPFPLGKKKSKASLPRHYEQVFGYGKDNLADYKSEVKEFRWKQIRRRWSQCRPQVMICFGAKDTFLDFLHHVGQKVEPIPLTGTNAILCVEEKRILITPHFSGRPWQRCGSDDVKLEVIDKKLREWKLQLP